MKKIYLAGFIGILIVCVILLILFQAKIKQRKDSAKIAFCEHDNKYWQVWTMDLDGSNRKKLTSSEVDKRSPDLSGDGRKIAYVTNDGKLMTMSSRGDDKKQIRLNISASEPRWCFEDEKIIFTSYRGVSLMDDSDIWMINSDGTDLKKIIRRASIQYLPDVSGDEKKIVFVDVSEVVGHEIYKLNTETNDYTQLTENRSHDTAPVFTADADKIIYSSDEDGNYDIWIMDEFGRNAKNLTRRPAFDSSPVLSKEGKTIYFLSDSSGSTQIWSVNIDGTELAQITNDAKDKQDISIYAP